MKVKQAGSPVILQTQEISGARSQMFERDVGALCRRRQRVSPRQCNRNAGAFGRPVLEQHPRHSGGAENGYLKIVPNSFVSILGETKEFARDANRGPRHESPSSYMTLKRHLRGLRCRNRSST